MELALSRTLHALVATLDRAADRILRTEFGIGYAPFLTLYTVDVLGNATQRDVAGRLGATEAAVSRSLRTLAEDGLVLISPSPAGGHRRDVSATPRGHDLVRSAGGELERRLAQVLAAAEVGYEEYTGLTERLLAAVTAPNPAVSR